MKIQVLLSPGCSHGRATLDLVGDVARASAPGADVETVLVTTEEDAKQRAFGGSPTVLVDGVDIDPPTPVNTGLG